MIDRAMPEIYRAVCTPDLPSKAFLMYLFPIKKKEIARLTHEEKMEWYAFQFQIDPQGATVLLSSPEFERFWKWRVLIPLKVKRFYFRLKNLELFRHYPHISEMKKKVKKHSI